MTWFCQSLPYFMRYKGTRKIKVKEVMGEPGDIIWENCGQKCTVKYTIYWLLVICGIFVVLFIIESIKDADLGLPGNGECLYMKNDLLKKFDDSIDVKKV